MDENVKEFLQEASLSSMDKSSSDSSDTEGISKPTSSKRKKEIASEESENNFSTTSKPSSSIKRCRGGKEKEEIQLSSKKMKKFTQVDEKSPKKRGYWKPEDEIAFLKGLLAFCEKGKLRNLPKNMEPFFQLVLNDLDGEYSTDQLYNKLLKLRAKYFGVRDNMKDEGFVGFKNAQEESVYMLSKQVWGKGLAEEVGSVQMGEEVSVRAEEVGSVQMGEEGSVRAEEVGSVQMGEEGSVRAEEKKQDDVGEGKEVKRNKSGDVEMSVMGEEYGEEDDEEDGDEDDDDGEEEKEEEEEEEEQGKHEQIDNVGEEVSHVSGSGLNKVEGMKTEKSVEDSGEETDSSEENVGEERDSSDESESEPNGNENVGEEMYSSEENEENVGEEQDSSEESEESENESSGDEHSARPDSNSSLTESHTKENLAGHVLNGASRDQNVAEGVSNDLHAAGTTDMRNNGSSFAQYIPNGTANRPMENFCAEHSGLIEGLSYQSPFAYQSPLASLVSFTGKLPALSDKEEEMLEQKWKEQRRLEMEVSHKHISLVREGYELLLAQVRAKLGNHK